MTRVKVQDSGGVVGSKQHNESNDDDYENCQNYNTMSSSSMSSSQSEKLLHTTRKAIMTPFEPRKHNAFSLNAANTSSVISIGGGLSLPRLSLIHI